jgi:hypothetical protein
MFGLGEFIVTVGEVVSVFVWVGLIEKAANRDP